MKLLKNDDDNITCVLERWEKSNREKKLNEENYLVVTLKSPKGFCRCNTLTLGRGCYTLPIRGKGKLSNHMISKIDRNLCYICLVVSVNRHITYLIK